MTAISVAQALVPAASTLVSRLPQWHRATLLVARCSGSQQRLALGFRIDEVLMQHRRVGVFEIVARIFLFGRR